MKVKDAKEKWCPMAGAWDGTQENTIVANRDDFGRPSSRCMCIGDECACWVWSDEEGDEYDDVGRCGLAR